MRCIRCDGIDSTGCPSCGGAGIFEIHGCPARFAAGVDVMPAMTAARQAEHGRWPVAGGWLDQTQKCLDVVEFIAAEKAQWKARNAEE